MLLRVVKPKKAKTPVGVGAGAESGEEPGEGNGESDAVVDLPEAPDADGGQDDGK